MNLQVLTDYEYFVLKSVRLIVILFSHLYGPELIRIGTAFPHSGLQALQPHHRIIRRTTSDHFFKQCIMELDSTDVTRLC